MRSYMRYRREDMTPLARVFLLSVLFCLVLLRESLGAPTAVGRSVDEGSPGGDALQGKDMRREWQENLRLLEPRTREKTKRWEAEMKALVEGLERRMKDLENRMSALEEVKLVDARGRDEFDRLNGRLSRLEDSLQRAVDRCSPAAAPPTPSSSPIPSSAYSSTTSSTSSDPSPPSSSTSSATTNYHSTSTSTTTSSAFPSTTTTTSSATSASSSASPFNPSTDTSEFLTSASVFKTTPAPWASQAYEPQPSAASATPPTADPALRNALGKELYEAARDGNMQEVERLLDAGADPSYAIGSERNAPLMAASFYGHAPVVSLLLRRGADVHAANGQGHTALHFAAAFDHSDRLVPLLLAAGARVDSRDWWGMTPLHLAAQENNEAAVRALLAAGASKTLKDDDGLIPLDRVTSDAVRALLRP